MGGSGSSYYMNAVWNYDPKTDLYRWVAGRVDSPNENYVVLGDFGVQDPNATIGSAIYAGSAIDHNDNIWIYGNGDQPSNLFCMFNTTSYQFTYLGFESVTTPVVGEKGIHSPDNYPGERNGASVLVDSQNNLWMLGGTRPGLWHFNTTSLEWALMWGNTSNSMPTDFENKYWGLRVLAPSTIDEDDRIWTFGGYSYQSPRGYWGDLWSFDTKTLEWRVEWGDESSVNTNGSVVDPDTFDIGNYPRARYGPVMVDRKDGTLLIGSGYFDSLAWSSTLYLNDFWLFNKTNKLWKLVYGDVEGNVATEFTNYRTEGSLLGGRSYPGGVGGLHSRGNLILFGGNTVTDTFSDIWIFPQDQCLIEENGGCDVNAVCTTVDYFQANCTCNEGYVGDGKTCTVAVPATSPSDNSPVGTTPSSKTSGSEKILASIFTCILLVFV
jgi:hypothetical protein